MSGAIEKVTAHWRQVATRRKVHVPEWGVDVWYRPPNIAERIRLEKVLNEKGDHAAAVEAVLLLAQDEAGNRLFSDGERPELMREADPDVIVRLAGMMMSPPDPEEIEKN